MISARENPLFRGGALNADRPVEIYHNMVSTEMVEQAIAAGAQLLEADVQLTRDGVLAAHWGMVSVDDGEKCTCELTFDQMREVVAEDLLRIEDLFDLTKGRAAVDLDMKDWCDSVAPGYRDRALVAVDALIRKCGMCEDVYAATFSKEYMIALKKLNPQVVTGFSLHKKDTPDAGSIRGQIEYAKANEFSAIALYREQLTLECAREIKDAGILVVLNAGQGKLDPDVEALVDMMYVDLASEGPSRHILA